jgi:RND family efflux transporter MFP subunit
MANIQLSDIQGHLGRNLIFSLLVGFFLVGSFGCTEEPVTRKATIRPVKAMIVADADQIAGRRFPGKATATQEVNLSFDVSGTIVERPVNVGDSVKKGQLIAQLDQRDFLSNVKAGQAAVKRDRKNFERAKELVGKGHISQADYDRLEAKVEVAESDLSVASKALADSVMKAPFDGRIANLFVENHQAVRAKQEIARLLDASSVEFTIQIPEQLISLVSYIRDIQVEFDSYTGHPIPATISEIGTEASATTRTYPVTLIMEQPDGFEILPGMSGSATGRPELPDNLMAKGIMVPVTAVFSAGEASDNFVWVIDEQSSTVSRRPVKVGELADTGIPVTSGLKAGERIVIAGVSYLREGQEVKLLDRQGDRGQ